MYQKHRFFIRYLIALLMFGFNGIVASHIALDSGQIVLLRTLLGSISLLAFFFLSGHRFSFAGRGMDVTLILLSGAAMGASWMFLYAGYQTIGVSTASLLYYSGPVIVMALSPLVFHKALTWVKVTGFLCVCGGIVLVNGLGGGQINAAGFIYGIMSAVCYAVMLILNKKARAWTAWKTPCCKCFRPPPQYFFCCCVRVGLPCPSPPPAGRGYCCWASSTQALAAGATSPLSVHSLFRVWRFAAIWSR